MTSMFQVEKTCTQCNTTFTGVLSQKLFSFPSITCPTAECQAVYKYPLDMSVRVALWALVALATAGIVYSILQRGVPRFAAIWGVMIWVLILDYQLGKKIVSEGGKLPVETTLPDPDD